MDIRNIPPLSEFSHSVDLQIRFNDVDVLGHVNNTVYMAFFDTGKAHFFRSVVDDKIDWGKVEVVVANIDCAFAAPIFFGENIAVYTKFSALSNRSFRVLQVIARKEDGEIKSACETVMVSFDPATQRVAEMPERWRRAIETEMAKA